MNWTLIITKCYHHNFNIHHIPTRSAYIYPMRVDFVGGRSPGGKRTPSSLANLSQHIQSTSVNRIVLHSLFSKDNHGVRQPHLWAFCHLKLSKNIYCTSFKMVSPFHPQDFPFSKTTLFTHGKRRFFGGVRIKSFPHSPLWPGILSASTPPRTVRVMHLLGGCYIVYSNKYINMIYIYVVLCSNMCLFKYTVIYIYIYIHTHIKCLYIIYAQYLLNRCGKLT